MQTASCLHSPFPNACSFQNRLVAKYHCLAMPSGKPFKPGFMPARKKGAGLKKYHTFSTLSSFFLAFF